MGQLDEVHSANVTFDFVGVDAELLQPGRQLPAVAWDCSL